VDLLEQRLGAGWQFETKAVFDAPCHETARYVRPPMGSLSSIDDGTRCLLTGTTSNPANVRRRVAGRDPDPVPCRGRT